MRLRESLRVPLLLVTCFVTALLFPRACDRARTGLGAMFPATAPLSGADHADEAAAAREEQARLAHLNARLEETLEALPLSAEGTLGRARVVRPAATAPTLIAARVRQRDASARGRSFLIDAGRADGVEIGLPVLHGQSLVGLVVSLTDHAARVVRIDDPTTASIVPATIVPGPGSPTACRTTGVSRGSGDDDVIVSLLRPGDARPGDLAVTGVGNPLVPEGLTIGEVAAFDDADRDGTFEAEVRPLRDLDSLNSVFVLRDAAAVSSAPRVGARRTGAPK